MPVRNRILKFFLSDRQENQQKDIPVVAGEKRVKNSIPVNKDIIRGFPLIPML